MVAPGVPTADDHLNTGRGPPLADACPGDAHRAAVAVKAVATARAF
jgi:hypothetical protein